MVFPFALNMVSANTDTIRMTQKERHSPLSPYIVPKVVVFIVTISFLMLIMKSPTNYGVRIPKSNKGTEYEE
jgi:hypothetical protein